MFLVCLALIVLANISVFGLRFKYNRDTKNHVEKVFKVEYHIKKKAVMKSINRYAWAAELHNQ